jgi:hypothetical protein
MDVWAAAHSPSNPYEAVIHYLVDTPDGPVGVLIDVTEDANGEPATLIIGQGWFGRRTLTVAADSVIGINHRARRILLAAGAAPIESSPWLRFFG